MADDLENVPLTQQDHADIDEALAAAKQGDPRAVMAMYSTVRLILETHGFATDTLASGSDRPGRITLRARRASSKE